jgi:hypothetical protein
VPLSLWASGASLLCALTEAHLRSFHALRLRKHDLGALVHLQRARPEQLGALGKTRLVVHTMMMFG